MGGFSGSSMVLFVGVVFGIPEDLLDTGFLKMAEVVRVLCRWYGWRIRGNCLSGEPESRVPARPRRWQRLHPPPSKRIALILGGLLTGLD